MNSGSCPKTGWKFDNPAGRGKLILVLNDHCPFSAGCGGVDLHPSPVCMPWQGCRWHFTLTQSSEGASWGVQGSQSLLASESRADGDGQEDARGQGEEMWRERTFFQPREEEARG